MPIRPRNAIGILLLAALAGSSWLWSRFETNTALLQLPDDVSIHPGYYLIDAMVLGTDEEGNLRYRLNADRIDERPDQSGLTFNNVAIEYAAQTDSLWTISAAVAEGPADLEFLDLYDHVLLSGLTGNRQPMTIETSILRFDPHNLIATTDAEVLVTSGGLQLSAVGLEARLQDNVLDLELRSELRSRLRQASPE